MFLLSILIAGAQTAPSTAPLVDVVTPEVKVRIESAPRDVAAFIDRRAGCNHFGGETGSGDPEREQQVLEAVTELRCDEIEADERSLQRAYREQSEVLDLLEQTRDVLW